MAGLVRRMRERLRRALPRSGGGRAAAPEPERYLVRGTCSLLDREADVITRGRVRIQVTVPAEPDRPPAWEGVLTGLDRPEELERRFYGVNRTLGLKLDGGGLGEIMVTAFLGPAGPEREYVFHGYGQPPVDLPPPGAPPPTTSA